MVTKRDKFIIFSIVIIILIIVGGIILDFKALPPERAMERHMKKKFGEEWTCISCEYESGGGYMVISPGWWDGVLTNNKYPGLEVECTAFDEGFLKYRFTDNYQQQMYLPDVQKIMEETAAKYFEADYYVDMDTYESREDSHITPVMSYEECVKRYDIYKVYIYVYHMPDTEAIDAMIKFMDDVEEQGFRYSFYLMRNTINDKEEFFTVIKEEEDRWRDVSEYLYYKDLHADEEYEPDIYLKLND